MKAFVTGVTGQDGVYLSEHLISLGYEVHGTVRRSSSINTNRIDHLIAEHDDSGNFNLHYADLLDPSSLTNLINKIQPDEIYNLASQSHVAVSFQNPFYTIQTSASGPMALLEGIKNTKKDIKYYQASSSEMFGGIDGEFLNENSKFIPKSPYAAGKVFAHDLTKIYRESYDLFAVNGILFNHESPHRGETFVTKKITKAVGRIYHNIQSKLTLGNIDAFRDWGFAGDYTKGMYKMLQHSEPDDWVLATGEAHSVKEFAEIAFKYAGLDWEEYVLTSKKYERPNEVKHLLGDASKAKSQLGWKPETDFNSLVEMMVDHDMQSAEKESVLLKESLISPTWEHPVK